jgi:hypothetical protein
MQFIEEMQNSAVVFFVKDVSNQDKFVGILIAFRLLEKLSTSKKWHLHQ